VSTTELMNRWLRDRYSFDESKVNRDSDGQFAEKAGGSHAVVDIGGVPTIRMDEATVVANLPKPPKWKLTKSAHRDIIDTMKKQNIPNAVWAAEWMMDKQNYPLHDFVGSAYDEHMSKIQAAVEKQIEQAENRLGVSMNDSGIPLVGEHDWQDWYLEWFTDNVEPGIESALRTQVDEINTSQSGKMSGDSNSVKRDASALSEAVHNLPITPYNPRVSSLAISGDRPWHTPETLQWLHESEPDADFAKLIADYVGKDYVRQMTPIMEHALPDHAWATGFDSENDSEDVQELISDIDFPWTPDDWYTPDGDIDYSKASQQMGEFTSQLWSQIDTAWRKANDETAIAKRLKGVDYDPFVEDDQYSLASRMNRWLRERYSFDESKVKRDSDGKFADKSDAAAKAITAKIKLPKLKKLSSDTRQWIIETIADSDMTVEQAVNKLADESIDVLFPSTSFDRIWDQAYNAAYAIMDEQGVDTLDIDGMYYEDWICEGGHIAHIVDDLKRQIVDQYSVASGLERYAMPQPDERLALIADILYHTYGDNAGAMLDQVDRYSFDESKINRDADGQFADKAGGEHTANAGQAQSPHSQQFRAYHESVSRQAELERQQVQAKYSELFAKIDPEEYDELKEQFEDEINSINDVEQEQIEENTEAEVEHAKIEKQIAGVWAKAQKLEQKQTAVRQKAEVKKQKVDEKLAAKIAKLQGKKGDPEDIQDQANELQFEAEDEKTSIDFEVQYDLEELEGERQEHLEEIERLRFDQSELLPQQDSGRYSLVNQMDTWLRERYAAKFDEN
jgi:hypothetical protein